MDSARRASIHFPIAEHLSSAAEIALAAATASAVEIARAEVIVFPAAEIARDSAAARAARADPAVVVLGAAA